MSLKSFQLEKRQLNIALTLAEIKVGLEKELILDVKFVIRRCGKTLEESVLLVQNYVLASDIQS